MSTYNIEMNMLNSSNGYDVLYPKTDYNNLINIPSISSDVEVKSEIVSFKGNGNQYFFPDIFLTKTYNYILGAYIHPLISGSPAYKKYSYNNSHYSQYKTIYFGMGEGIIGCGIVSDNSNTQKDYFSFNLTSSFYIKMELTNNSDNYEGVFCSLRFIYDKSQNKIIYPSLHYADNINGTSGLTEAINLNSERLCLLIWGL